MDSDRSKEDQAACRSTCPPRWSNRNGAQNAINVRSPNSLLVLPELPKFPCRSTRRPRAAVAIQSANKIWKNLNQSPFLVNKDQTAQNCPKIGSEV
nr:hypothetical protein [Tanacetum cinerariifolium]